MIYYNVRLRRTSTPSMVVSIYVYANSDDEAIMQAKLGLLDSVPRWLHGWLTRDRWEVCEVEPIDTTN